MRKRNADVESASNTSGKIYSKVIAGVKTEKQTVAKHAKTPWKIRQVGRIAD
ncbi:hypothetical protein ABLO26_03595 [Neobacillus sp. 179-J 1A1 HS]|uniref:hypothetical protein n=1 Tax=Neobacillus driksii TaxID=3035913 RepID=UPI0035BBB341